MGAKKKRTANAAKAPENAASAVSDPVTTFGRTSPRKRAARATKRKGYDARKFTGMIPGIAERMKVYLKHMRDDR